MKSVRKKINKSKSWLFEKINKIDQPLARPNTKKKKRKMPVTNIKNKRWHISTYMMEK